MSDNHHKLSSPFDRRTTSEEHVEPKTSAPGILISVWFWCRRVGVFHYLALLVCRVASFCTGKTAGLTVGAVLSGVLPRFYFIGTYGPIRLYFIGTYGSHQA